MADHFADRLLAAIATKGAPACVGIDPDLGKLPDELRKAAPPAAMEAFGRGVIDAVAGHVPAVKPQIAYFERFGHAGVAAYERVVAAARAAGLVVIGDVKRNDIGSTAGQYAAGHLGSADGPDAITVNGYFGADGTAPFIDAAAQAGKGVFILVRTSNPSAAAVQDFADASGKKFYVHLAQQVASWGEAPGLVGTSGYSCVGAVVGATYPAEAAELRTIMPRQIFLLPGYGAQGATADDCMPAFKADGTGAIVNAGRSVIYAYHGRGGDWRAAVRDAAKAFADDLREALARRR